MHSLNYNDKYINMHHNKYFCEFETCFQKLYILMSMTELSAICGIISILS